MEAVSGRVLFVAHLRKCHSEVAGVFVFLWSSRPGAPRRRWTPRKLMAQILNLSPIPSMGLVYLHTFTIKINQMLVNIPYMDGMGHCWYHYKWRLKSCNVLGVLRVKS